MTTTTLPPLKVTYFNDNKGRNELIRLIFIVGKIPFEDELIGFKEYATMRSSKTLPYGQVPTLTIMDNEGNEEVFGQSCSLARYAAKKAGLYPKDDIEALRTDGVVDSWRDTLDLFYGTVFDRKIVRGSLVMVPHPKSARYGKLVSFLSSELMEQFARYEKMLQSTGGQFCKDGRVPFPSWADLAVYDLVKTMKGALAEEQFQRLMDGKGSLNRLVEKIDCLEEIKTHLTKNPYKDIRAYFEKVSPVAYPIELLLMPVMNFFIFLAYSLIGFGKCPEKKKS
mmetsp:Transcript_24114/g.48828  ORF Transcript_24114/g.48828 Transcript_24114/m.48828 type:complete len:281 (-) Transcript_24114:93-935(-)